MGRFFAFVVGATSVALSVMGCGEDSNDASNDGSHSQCLGNNAEFTAAEFAAQTVPRKACSEASDVSLVCENDMPKLGGQCGKGCLGMGDDAAQAECVGGCIQEELLDSDSQPLSEDCLACYTADIECARKNCLVSCGLDPGSEGCFVCRTDNGCVDDFYACSGLPEPTSGP